MLSDDVLVPLGDVRHGAGLAVLAHVGLLPLLGRLLLRVDPLVVEHELGRVLVPGDLGHLKSAAAWSLVTGQQRIIAVPAVHT